MIISFPVFCVSDRFPDEKPLQTPQHNLNINQSLQINAFYLFLGNGVVDLCMNTLFHLDVDFNLCFVTMVFLSLILIYLIYFLELVL